MQNNRLPQKAILEFKQILQTILQKEVSYEEAERLGNEFMSLFYLIIK